MSYYNMYRNCQGMVIDEVTSHVILPAGETPLKSGYGCSTVFLGSEI